MPDLHLFRVRGAVGKTESLRELDAIGTELSLPAERGSHTLNLRKAGFLNLCAIAHLKHLRCLHDDILGANSRRLVAENLLCLAAKVFAPNRVLDVFRAPCVFERLNSSLGRGEVDAGAAEQVGAERESHECDEECARVDV